MGDEASTDLLRSTSEFWKFLSIRANEDSEPYSPSPILQMKAPRLKSLTILWATSQAREPEYVTVPDSFAPLLETIVLADIMLYPPSPWKNLNSHLILRNLRPRMDAFIRHVRV